MSSKLKKMNFMKQQSGNTAAADVPKTLPSDVDLKPVSASAFPAAAIPFLISTPATNNTPSSRAPNKTPAFSVVTDQFHADFSLDPGARHRDETAGRGRR
eukprot:CAMPEP_0184721262 /NCGR_PEP_ID=MMETSP0314-20130426/17639_1 /TAXON_ID=38298 /ORGANISM="Rhodella maculata, Strain CCMP 736" /LENGTH=99 /DNA_ID=CAMNT_0027185585 /DNA_START=28 /DNA_END=323 /DNA_ORIENTATION=-